MKWVLATVVVLAVLVLGGLWVLNWMMNQSLYALGSVRDAKGLRGPLEPPAQNAKDSTEWIVEPDIRLHFEAHGEGRPVLVVHGGPGVPYAKPWKGLESLTDRFRFYYYHQRGCGESSRPFDRFAGGNFYSNMVELEQTLGLGAQIADIERIRRILGQEKLILIGHSYGGFLATLYAAEFPERVDKLVLVAPAGVLTAPDERRDLFQLARGQLPPEDQARFDDVHREYFDFSGIFDKSEEDLVDLHNRTGRFLLTAMGYTDEPAKTPRSGGWAVFAMYFSAGRAPDYRPALERVEAPTLIVHGEDDRLTLPGANTYEPIPGARFALLGRDDPDTPAGHFLFDDCPQGFAKAVGKFLRE